MTDAKVRVRFAPSPTGPLHIGGVRTALYNYLFAKKHGGDFLLRIEDTDQTRFVPGAEEYVIEALKWCGITPDEGPGFGGEYGPYRQSDRKGSYREYAEQLIKDGKAYYAFDTSEELTEMRDRLKLAKVASPQYNTITRETMRNSLTMSSDDVENQIAEGMPYVIRFKMPRKEEVRVHDIIRGWVLVNTDTLDDKVLFKSDGMPTYHLANIVDDHKMKITHVIRGEEWLPSAPLHVLLYEAFGWEAPKFAHLPLLLKPDGNGKLSKRDGDKLGFPVFPLEWKDPSSGEISSGYREQGYFKGAFINMLAFLGWNPGTTQELFSMDELIQAFTLERVGKAGAKFDPDKTKWFNQQYLRSKTDAELAEAIKPISEEMGYQKSDEFLAGVCTLMKERASFIPEIVTGGIYLFEKPETYDEKTVSKKWKEDTPDRMRSLMGDFEKIENFDSSEIEVVFKAFLERESLGMGAVLPNLRLLVTGEGMGPSLFEIMALLGKEESLDRMKTGIDKLS
ncbi:glutamate--tRNA ligase [Cryomorpha ignava]|uniref:Glutamate--tRNA ligase n=1 Tax=Cryomorpha ignava TaxID=101383 RepID=A0A7K3WML0_9FLAO|nr:glutamate--tRNA ligase [Cryomorpha ignava]NEN22122.1 glutamate--tRNA ligase [Cryomorpha ignava]